MEPSDRFSVRDEPEVNGSEALGELRRLLFGPEREQLGKLQERLDNPAVHAEDISRVLPDAIIARARQNGDLASALSSTISESIKASVKNDPQPLVDALFPVIGPAIRKSISDALQRMVQSLNQTVEYSLSAKSWRWRLEARRTGKSFAEIVLLHTLVYRVEQVFLIHRNSGLLLQHMTADAVAAQDGDMVSGMLTAVQDFVRDSFGARDNETLDDLRVGERIVWIEQGPQAVLAAVVWGMPPRELKAKLQEVCEQLHREQGNALTAFEGDTAPFELARPVLETCLVQARQESIEQPKELQAPAKPKGSRLPLVVGSALIAALMLASFIHYGRQRNAWKNYVREVEAQQGIVVIAAGQGGQFTIFGLRDPLARDPRELLRNYPRLAGVQVNDRWEAYQSLSPQFVLARANITLNPPSTATLSLANGILHGHGMASATWIADARRIAPALAGISSFDDLGLSATDVTADILRKAAEVLAPPATASLDFSNGVLTARGSAPADWAPGARRIALLIPGVTRWNDQISAVDPRAETLIAARTALKPPGTIQLSMSGADLIASGSASHQWIVSARQSAASLSGMRYLDYDVSDNDMVELASRQSNLQRLHVVRFERFNVEPAVGQEKEFDTVAQDIKALLDSSNRAGVRLRISVIGHTDSIGGDEARLRLAQQRAARVVALLLERGVTREILTPMGIADQSPFRGEGGGVDPSLSSCVSLRVEYLMDHP